MNSFFGGKLIVGISPSIMALVPPSDLRINHNYFIAHSIFSELRVVDDVVSKPSTTVQMEVDVAGLRETVQRVEDKTIIS